jgi:hypothetical protein
MKFRGNGLKSRNNYSLTDTSNKEASLSTGAILPHGGQSHSFIQGVNHFDGVGHRGSVGGVPASGNVLRNYDSDTSIFADICGNLNENSFNEQILDKNKIAYIAGGGAAGPKRVGSNERIHRPRSSKGNRGLVNSTAQGNFFANQPQGQPTAAKFVVNKNEERVNKSQQQTRTRTGKSR